MAPEVLNQRYNEKCDLWSAGLILLVMLVGSLPWKSSDRFELTKQIQNGDLCLDEKISGLSEEAQDLIR